MVLIIESQPEGSDLVPVKGIALLMADTKSKKNMDPVSVERLFTLLADSRPEKVRSYTCNVLYFAHIAKKK